MSFVACVPPRVLCSRCATLSFCKQPSQAPPWLARSLAPPPPPPPHDAADASHSNQNTHLVGMGRPRFSRAALERFRERLVCHLRAQLPLDKQAQQNSVATVVAHRSLEAARKVKRHRSMPNSHAALLRIRSQIVAQLRAHIAALRVKEEANDAEPGKCSVIAVPGTEVSSNARVFEEDPGYTSLGESVASNSSELKRRRAIRRNRKRLQKTKPYTIDDV